MLEHYRLVSTARNAILIDEKTGSATDLSQTVTLGDTVSPLISVALDILTRIACYLMISFHTIEGYLLSIFEFLRLHQVLKDKHFSEQIENFAVD